MHTVVRALIAAALLAAPAPGHAATDHWPSYAGPENEAHYSPLAQITDKNIGRLGLAWSADLGVTQSFSSPLEIDGVLYFATGFSVLHAMDARTGKELWSYDPEVHKYAGEKFRAGMPIRGIAFDNGKVFTGTLDGRLIAVDAKSGDLLWSVMTIDADDGRYITGPPWVFDGKVAIGHGGSDGRPFRGYVTAYDQETGRKAWRFHTVPGDPALGFENKAMEMAAKTWSGEWWKWGGGGSVWNAMAYDPKLNRLYIGTGNGFPWNQKVRSPGGGDNLFLCGIVALDADTGAYVWHYQSNPGESWDYNANMDIILADLAIGGQQRPVLLHAPKNGFFYVIDRADGKLISAEKFTKVNWAQRIDLKTGRPVENPEARYPDGKLAAVYPSSQGAHSVQAMSFNPKTGLAYIPAAEDGAYFIDAPDLPTWQPAMNLFINTATGAPPAGTPPLPPRKSFLVAWNPLTQKQAWKLPLKNGENGGTLTTGGNLVVQGQSTGELLILNATTGKIVWTFDAQNGILSNPISYMLDGKQHITVITGFRSFVANNPAWDYRAQDRRVLTFVLDGKAKLPVRERVTQKAIDDPGFKIDVKKAELGDLLYNTRCFICHGFGMISGGSAPDLRMSNAALSMESLSDVVQHGVLQPAGMPRFDEFTDAEVEGLRHYIRQRARETVAAAD